jgi:hypothetical protein
MPGARIRLSMNHCLRSGPYHCLSQMRLEDMTHVSGKHITPKTGLIVRRILQPFTGILAIVTRSPCCFVFAYHPFDQHILVFWQRSSSCSVADQIRSSRLVEASRWNGNAGETTFLKSLLLVHAIKQTNLVDVLYDTMASLTELHDFGSRNGAEADEASHLPEDDDLAEHTGSLSHETGVAHQ